MKQKVVVGLSGGVDSAVSAYLLKKQGYKVIGFFMKNWDEQDPQCPQYQDYLDVVKICHHLEIDYYTVNFTKEYFDEVFQHFLQGLEKGITPNPDILCNRYIKFSHLQQKAISIGADYLATGHYARCDQRGRLLRAKDLNKDQTYFLYRVDGATYQKVLFPLGSLHKSEVRNIAERLQLPVAQKRDSTGICFIGKRNFKDFILEYIPAKPGKFFSIEGKYLGDHKGYWLYTIGQRKGLGIGGEGEAWFVVDKDSSSNSVIVAQGENHPALFRKEVFIEDLHWIVDPPSPYSQLTAKIRYRTEDVPCTWIEDEGKVVFQSPVRAPAPGQSLVFYDGDVCLGGAILK